MANELTNSVVISRNDSGFPPYLDFDALRTSSIEYLSGLTGKVWTDYNAHDPGITILEMLIYALLDLGYRTNLPAIDIFTKSSSDTSGENNFFTPAQILSCNPLTVTDFRKLLIDIDGVKNAWLDIAEDVLVGSICKPETPVDVNEGGNEVNEVSDNVIVMPDYINGLYHISLELDDPLTRKESDIITDVKNALLSHRNLCEDFLDISVLCPVDIGICADIILDGVTGAEDVYRNIVVSLNEFFSPAPKFYTLQQLLEKQKPIEDIFAGRPYNFMQSFGFVDTDEFDAITLKHEIHLSDVYNVILSVSGVKTVRNLKLKLGGANFSAAWQFQIPDNYTPHFSTAISSLNFSSNGTAIPIDLQKSEAYLKIASGNTATVLKPAANLDLEIPTGVYHNDLVDYYSIQNEFPLVYGIGQGGLPESALVARKAQALQLKGYLLFYDQLLANYLSQLNNIRSLFSFRPSPDADSRHTYFLNQLNTVPDFSKLTINIADENGMSNAGSNGSILAYPVKKIDFEKLINQGNFSRSDLTKIQQEFSCKSRNDFNIIVSLLQNDFDNELYTPSSAVATLDNGWFCYIDTSSDEFVLTGKIFSSKADAENAIQLLPHIASLPESYNGYSGNGAFTFNIQLNLLQYNQYLQQITENTIQYNTRRDTFLNHLLSRFAEQFTDFALLSYGFLEQAELTKAVIQSKEDFLTRYPVLSSERGKAFDYRMTAGIIENISGLEKRFKAYTGINNNACKSLCNFEVAAYEDTYSVKLILAGFHLFDTTARYEGLNKAHEALEALFSSLSNADKYKLELIPQEEKYQLQVQYADTEVASYPGLIQEQTDAEDLIRNIQMMYAAKINEENIIISTYEYRLELSDGSGKAIRLSANPFDSAEDAFASSIAALKTPNDTSKWQILSEENNPSGKFCSNNRKKPEKLVDLESFKIDISNTIVGKPDKYSYELLDKQNAFKFRSLNEFDNENQARTDCYRLLMSMVDVGNYEVIRESRRNKLYVLNNGQRAAECLNRLDSEIKAKEFRDKVCSIVKGHYYILSAVAFPSRWKFTFQLGFEKEATLLFVSDDDFETKENALAAAEKFNGSLATVNLEVINEKYSLKTPGNRTGTLTCTNAGNEIVKEDNDTKIGQVKSFLTLRKEINERLQSKDVKPFEEGIEIDEISKTGRYVFRLVDKDHLRASHKLDPGPAPNDQLNTLYNAAQAGYQVLDICLGGDITEAYTEGKTKTVLYRYVIKCRNDCAPFKKDAILFKSITGYAAVGDAENAFNDQYPLIINKASDATNYGTGKYISLGEPVAGNAGSAARNESVVFVPKDIQALKQGEETDIVQQLVGIAKSYPIRIVEKCSDEFKKFFPANDCQVTTVSADCANTTVQYVYYFVLYNRQAASLDWQSIQYYETATDARQGFYFFMMLLLYKGNYFIDNDDSGMQAIYIREVLAESMVRFMDDEAAWGKDGIEKFICISQVDDAFHASLNNKICRYSFFVACDSANAIHPCKYDTPAIRDEALDKLYKSFKDLAVDKLFKIISEEDREVLYGADGKQLAVIYKTDPTTTGDVACKRIMEILELSATNGNYQHDEDGKYWLGKTDEKDDTKFIKLAEPYDGGISEAQWKEQLLTLAYFYPVKKVTDEQYCVEIKLPGFNEPDNLENNNAPFGCNEDDPSENNDSCYLAWKFTCCFNDCTAAFTKYEGLIQLLSNYDSYRPYFDCNCYSFGIALQAGSDIAAYGPQHYSTPDMVCDAIDRSKKLINSEGLHLVEHILLRPRFENDCTCEYLQQRNFVNKTSCEDLKWKEEVVIKGDDVEKDIPFVPGADPFSFIATIVLPAWPQRFRKKENRDLLETILNREVPAHILLRILWLKPPDTCEFESLYKEWKRWLLQKEDGDRKTATCDFITFLFKTDFNCLMDCTDCLPCAQSNDAETCFDEPTGNITKTGDFTWLDNINELFWWNRFSCTQPEAGTGDTPGNLLLTQDTISAPVIAPQAAQEKIEMTADLIKKKTRFINARLVRYKKNIARIYADSKENPIAGRANLVFAEKNLAKKINSLINDLLIAAPADRKKKLQQAQKDDLIRNLVWLYMDKMLFEENDISKINLLSDGFDKMRKAKFDMELLFNEWEPDEIAKYEGDANINTIRQILVKH